MLAIFFAATVYFGSRQGFFVGRGKLLAYIAVAFGGFAGAVVRYLLSEWIVSTSGFPVATFLINLAGSFFLSWFYIYTTERVSIHPHLRLGIGTGFVGAFTTFSTLTKESWTLVQGGLYGMAVLYVFLSFSLGLLCAFAGYQLAMLQSRLRFTREFHREV